MRTEKLNFKKWHVFYATNFVSLMKPSIFIYRLYGLIPCRMTNRSIEKSETGHLYCTVITFVYICMSFLILYIVNASTFVSKIKTWKLQANCFYALANFTLITNYIFGLPIVQILQNLSVTTAKLPREKFAKIAKWIHLKDVISFFLLIVHTPKIFTGSMLHIISSLIETYVTTCTYLLDFLYSNNIFILANCFQHLNEELVRLKDNAFKERAHLLRRLYHNQFNPLLFVKLRYLKQWHHELNELIRKINSTFSLQIVATVIITFTELTFGLYFYISELLHKNMRSWDIQVWYYFYYTVVIYYVSKLLLVTLTCQFANDENDKTRSIINEILINTDDKLFKEEVSMRQE